jgi:hypothetical protein
MQLVLTSGTNAPFSGSDIKLIIIALYTKIFHTSRANLISITTCTVAYTTRIHLCDELRRAYVHALATTFHRKKTLVIDTAVEDDTFLNHMLL